MTGFGNMDVLGRTVVEQHIHSTRGVAYSVSPSFRQVLEGWKKPSLLLRDWPGRMLRRTLTLLLKVFERLLKKHICSSIPVTLDPLQFAYRPNRSTDDAISQVVPHSKNGNYLRLLFIDYSSAFNTIVPTKLAVKTLRPRHNLFTL